MTGCSCPHDVSEHGSLVHFPTKMCLVAGCDCNGTHDEVIALAVERSFAKRHAAELAYQVIAEVIANPMRRKDDDLARNIAAALVATFEMRPR